MTGGRDNRIYCLLSFYRPHPKDGGRYCFHFVCQFTSQGGGYPIPGLGGYPIPGLAREVPHPRSGLEGTPSQVWSGGYPISGLARGVPGVPPDQVRMGYSPRSGMGNPLDMRWGTPQTWHGVPPWTWDGVPPGPGMGYPLDLGWGTPQTWDRIPPSIASTCYMAGGVPLAFTQEDFDVSFIFNRWCLYIFLDEQRP